MAEAQFKLTGADGIIDNMAALTTKLQKTTARRAARRAMVPIRNAARVNAQRIDDPKTKNKIYSNIAIQERSRTGRQIGGVAFSVGVRGGGRKGGTGAGGDTYYWRFKEFGTKNAAATPILRPAFNESNQQQAISILISELWAGIEDAQK